MTTLRKELLRALVVPGVIMVLATLAVAAGQRLPASLSGMGAYSPYALLLVGAVIGLWFNRGRVFIALVSLLLGYTGYRLALDTGAASFAARAVFTALTIFVPLNILAALLLPERGISHFRNYRWLLLLIAQLILTAWVASAGRSALSGTAWQGMLEHWLLLPAPVPFLGRGLMAAAFAVAVARAWPRHSPLDIGMAGALLAFFVGCQWPAAPGVFAAFVSAAGAMLLVALMQESHRMAFRDELTGLPGRRALEERLMALGPVYTIAMVDVDHFKKFNDTHGHDIGDQVLKLVGAQLAKTGGGGKAFRYGGEEFSLLFPDRTAGDVYPHLETLRQGIESYKMAVRSDDRPKDPENGRELRAFRKPDKILTVTVSIGVAERNEFLNSPAKVIRAADDALYRAKEKGRNLVSR